MKYLLATKEYMTQYFAEDGTLTPATVLKAGPVVITQVKTKEKDGYEAVQVGYKPVAERKLAKAQKGHFKDRGLFGVSREFRPKTKMELPALGETINAGVFAPGDTVAVTATSKGKGFQGVVKRHKFAGGSRTHGQKHSEREPGAIGGGGGRAGGRVAKGIRMAGMMGGERVTVRNLKVLAVDADANVLLISGALPGVPGALVEIRG